ncbi:MAG: metal-dependent transcriptional regulator [Caulobacteraceae bacterium]
MKNEDFFTFTGYMKKDDGLLTAAMEDYIEMIYRLSLSKGFTRINDLSSSLNIQPPSATKMVQKLADLNLANYEKYGYIILTEEGKTIGEGLLKRHKTVEEFLILLGVSRSVLEETEKIEHILNEETLRCISLFVNFIKDNPDIGDKFEAYRNNK